MELAISVGAVMEEKVSRHGLPVSKASTARNVSLNVKAAEENVAVEPYQDSRMTSAAASATASKTTVVTVGHLSNASVRGSSIGSDMAALTETIVGTRSQRLSPSASAKLEPEETETGEQLKKSVTATTTALNEQIKVEDWLSLDTGTYHPKYTSGKKHFLRIINTMDYDEKLMEVSNYMLINDLMLFYEMYKPACQNPRNYLWKNIWGKTLKLNKSLDENGLIDYSDVTDETGLDMFPTILLYFEDGFENEPPIHLDIIKNPSHIDISQLVPHRNY